ncbi:MAG: oligosaccharide flippase family protein, partial [Paracoccaceae bacterium]
AAGIAWFQSRGSFPADSGYTAAALPMTIIALGGASFLRGFASPVVFAYERDMRFKRTTLAILSENVLGLVVTILCAFWLRSIWALVLGIGFSAIVRVALSFWLFSGPSMRLDLHRPYLIIIWERGRWIIGHSTLTAIINTADRLLFSFVMSSATFGLYFIARQIIELAGQLLVNVHRQVALQLFKEITQTSDMAARRHKYYRYRRIFDAAAMLGAGALVVIAPLLIEIVFDDRYLGAAPFVQILALSLIFMPMAFIRDAYSAERRFRAITFFSLIQATVLWSGLCIAIFIFQSLILAVFVTALHRIPDITVLLVKSRAEGKVSLRKEIQFMPLLLVGGGIGWLIIRVADLVLK